MSPIGDQAKRFSRRDAWTEGRIFFEDAVRRDPRDAASHAHLGFFCVKESRYDTRRGLAEYEAALALEPDCLPAQLYKAVTLAYLLRRDAALEIVRAAEKRRAAPAPVVWAEGCVELEAGSVEKAADLFRRLVELEPESGNYIMVSKAFSQGGDNAEALKWAEKAFAVDSSDFRAPTYMGIYFAYLGRHADARRALEKAEAMKKEYALLQHTWAYVARAEGKNDEAERRLRYTLEIDPDYVTSSKLLADICAETGRADEARRHYGDALRLFPDYPEAKAGLARLGARP